MTVLELFEVLVWDGGERHIPKFYFSDKEDAEAYKKEHPRDTFQKLQFKIYYSYEDFKMNTDKAIRERALAKLTAEEKLVLGLN